MGTTHTTKKPSVSSKKTTLPLICGFVLAVFFACAIAGLIPQVRNLAEQSVASGRDVPRFNNPLMWFGTDVQGRSILLRIIVGTSAAIAVSFGGASISVGIGFVLGGIAGYYRGWVDNSIIWLYSTVAAVPWVLLVALTALGLRRMNIPPLMVVIICLGITDWVTTCRAVRGEVIRITETDFVLAAKALGLTGHKILRSHVLQNCFPVAAAIWGTSVAVYVQSEVALTFMGIGINDQPSWGRMIDDSRVDIIRGYWWQFCVATICVVAYSISITIGVAHWVDSRMSVNRTTA